MAGFAVFMSILIVGFFGIALATTTSIVSVVIGKKRIPQDLQGRRAFLNVCALAPFAGLLWLLVAFLIHIQISNRLAHQDCGLSADPYVTLPNGYVLGSLNTHDGYLVAPGYKTGMPVTGPGYVRSIIDLRWEDGVYSGTQFDFDAQSTDHVRGFTFDTRDLSIKTFAPAPLSWHAGDPSPLEHPDSYWNLYTQYRHHWPRYVFITLILTGEAAIAFFVWKSWAILRQRGVQPPLNSSLSSPPAPPPPSTAE